MQGFIASANEPVGAEGWRREGGSAQFGGTVRPGGTMAKLKTAPTKASVTTFLTRIDDDGRRRDCEALLRMMKRITRAGPVMWGPSIVGFGTYHYKYASSREGDWFLTGFSPRKQALTIYVMAGFKRYPALMKQLGRHATGSSCLYVKRLDELDLDVLQELIRESVRFIKAKAG